MKEFVYQNIIGEDGLPSREWVTDEEFDKRTADIKRIGNVLNEFAKASRKQYQEYCDKHNK
jgi:hypothetical protein